MWVTWAMMSGGGGGSGGVGGGSGGGGLGGGGLCGGGCGGDLVLLMGSKVGMEVWWVEVEGWEEKIGGRGKTEAFPGTLGEGGDDNRRERKICCFCAASAAFSFCRSLDSRSVGTRDGMMESL